MTYRLYNEVNASKQVHTNGWLRGKAPWSKKTSKKETSSATIDRLSVYLWCGKYWQHRLKKISITAAVKQEEQVTSLDEHILKEIKTRKKNAAM